MTKAYYQDDAVTLYLGDCREILPDLPQVDLVLTDPPYNLDGLSGGGFAGNAIYHNELLRTMADFEPEEHLQLWMSKQETTNIVAFGSRNLISRYSHWAEDHNLVYDLHTWYKPNAIPFCSGCFKSDIEYINLLYAAGRYFHSHLLQMQYSKVYTHNLLTNLKEKLHPTEKPLGIMAKYITILSSQDSLILDPFLGSGITAVAAKKLGRRCIGIEIEEKYLEIAANRCRQSVMDLSEPRLQAVTLPMEIK